MSSGTSSGRSPASSTASMRAAPRLRRPGHRETLAAEAPDSDDQTREVGQRLDHHVIRAVRRKPRWPRTRRARSPRRSRTRRAPAATVSSSARRVRNSSTSGRPRHSSSSSTAKQRLGGLVVLADALERLVHAQSDDVFEAEPIVGAPRRGSRPKIASTSARPSRGAISTKTNRHFGQCPHQVAPRRPASIANGRLQLMNTRKYSGAGAESVGDLGLGQRAQQREVPVGVEPEPARACRAAASRSGCSWTTGG